MLKNHKKGTPAAEQQAYVQQEDYDSDQDDDRWKIEKMEKGSSWKKRFQMMYRAKMLKLDKKVRKG